MPNLDVRRVLLVDDHEPSLCAIAEYLSSRRPWRIRTACRSDQALALAEEWHHHAVLVDLHLDGSSPETGLRVAEAVRAARRNARIVMITGHVPGPEVLARIHRVADVFLTKPVPLADVERALAGERAA